MVAVHSLPEYHGYFAFTPRATMVSLRSPINFQSYHRLPKSQEEMNKNTFYERLISGVAAGKHLKLSE